MTKITKKASQSITILKQMNKELALNMQILKQNIAELKAQNSSLKAEIYDLVIERGSLMDEKMKLISTLKNIGQEIGTTLNMSSSERSRLSSTKQSATICPMVSGYLIHKPEVKLHRLDFSDYPNAANAQDSNLVIDLSTIAEEEEQENVVRSRLGQRQRLVENVPYSASIVDYKQPVILLERYPIFSRPSEGSSQIEERLNSETNERRSDTPKRKSQAGRESGESSSRSRSPVIKSEGGSKAPRRSNRLKKEIKYF